MTTFLLIAMVLLLIGALERANRRQPPQPPGLRGTYDRNDRDWARTQLDLLALGGQSDLKHQPPPWSSHRLKCERLRNHDPRPFGSGQRIAGINAGINSD